MDATQTKIEVGTAVLTDPRVGGSWTWIGQTLTACTHWDAADYILPGNDFFPARAVKVAVTGRTVRFDAPGLRGVPVVRVSVVFVGDGEPDVKVGGWVRAAGYRW